MIEQILRYGSYVMFLYGGGKKSLESNQMLRFALFEFLAMHLLLPVFKMMTILNYIHVLMKDLRRTWLVEWLKKQKSQLLFAVQVRRHLEIIYRG